MKRIYSLLLLSALFFSGANKTFAQLVGDNVFLPGHFLQICVSPNGSLGSTLTSPAGYVGNVQTFTYDPIACTYVGMTTFTDNNIAECYDYGRNGWTVGAPAYYGDYTLPGSPWEGWSIQIGTGGIQDNAFYTDLGCGTYFSAFGPGAGATATPSMTGLITGYSHGEGACNTEDQEKAYWAGSYSGINIRMETRVDTSASWVVMTVVLTNTTGAAINDIYYMRSFDPDNDEILSGNFATNNTIAYNQPIAGTGDTVMVTATGQSYGGTFSGLCTIDCRAVCFIAESWPSFNENLASDYWSQNANTVYGGFSNTYAPGATDNGDYAIGLVYKVGTLAAGDSTVLCYGISYKTKTFASTTFANLQSGIDSVFQSPYLTINCSVPPPSPTSTPTKQYDTIDMCTYTGGMTATINLMGASDEFWGISNWTWSPTTGLSTSSGTAVTVNIADLTNTYTTYTIIGSSTSGSCQYINDTFLLTVKLCVGIACNSPCYGDSLLLTVIGGDSVNTYHWSGPAGFTATGMNPFVYPTTFADSGLYICVRDSATVPVDTYYVHAYINPLPLVTASSNSPLCATTVDVLDLTATGFAAGETFSWTGPSGTGFTSGSQNPSLTTFTIVDTGWYKVVTDLNGCYDSAETYVTVTPIPVFRVVNNGPLCEGSTLIMTAIDTYTVASNYVITGPTGGTSTTTNLLTVTSVPSTDSGVYTINLTVGSCPAAPVLDTVVIFTTPPAPVVTNTVYCSGYAPADTLVAVPYPGSSLLWYTTSSGGYPSTTSPTPSTTGSTTTYYVADIILTCESARVPLTVTINPNPPAPGVTPVSYCFYPNAADPVQNVSPLVATAAGTVTWYGPGLPFTGGSPSIVPSWPSTGDSSFYLVYGVSQVDPATGCVSDTSNDTVFINANPPAPLVTPIQYCQYDYADSNFLAPVLVATVIPGNTTYWSLAPDFTSAITTPPHPNTGGVRSWSNYVWQLNPLTGCYSDSAADLLVNIRYKPEPMITSLNTSVCQYDTMTLMYSDINGNVLTNPYFLWTIPYGDTFINANIDSIGGTTFTSVTIRFDSIYQDTIHLRASDFDGLCYTDTSLIVKVVPAPSASGSIIADACIGDTVTVGLSSRSFNAINFVWTVDNQPWMNGNVDSIVASSANSGGPYSIYFFNSGTHIIKITPYTTEGCPGIPAYDTITIHNLPIAQIMPPGVLNTYGGVLCASDSIRFSNADSTNYVNAYSWTPSEFFNSNNSAVNWGKIRLVGSVNIYLQVKDPWGCTSYDSLGVTTQSCCDVWFPNAFTPNGQPGGDNTNKRFGPLFYYNSFHQFAEFRITNRWGQTVFETTNNNEQWDGTFNGVPQDIGVYYYYLRFDCNGQTVEQHGDVTLIR